jgi:hypothetical protein
MKELQALLDEIASQGRNGDTMLAHINPQEAELLKALGGSGTTNPETGLPEFWGFSIGPVSVGSKGISVGGLSTSDIVDSGLNLTKELLKPAVAVGKWAWENPVEAAALGAAGYYFAPEIGAWIDSSGSAVVGTEAGTSAGAGVLTTEQVAAQQAAASAAAEQAAATAAAEQLAAEQAAAHVTSSVSAEALAAANATSDPLGALIAEQGWSVVDPAYLASIGVTAGMTPAISSAVGTGLTFSEALNLARAGLLVNAITGDPLGLGGSGGSQGSTAPTGFAMVPIPEDWKSPTYAASSAPIDLSTIFSNQNMLGGTQWQGLPSQQNMSFNDIFASGQQQMPMGTPVDINQIVSSILGQAATSQKSA